MSKGIIDLNKIKQIQFLQFSVLTSRELEQYGIKIDRPFTKKKTEKKRTREKEVDPYAGTPLDPRLGILGEGDLCPTCGNTVLRCPGHLGYIRLPLAVYNPAFVYTIKFILKSVCNSCSGMRLKKDNLDSSIISLKDFERLRRISVLSVKIKSCPHCDSPLNSKFKDNHGQIEKDGVIFPAWECLKVLEGISNETMELLGFNSTLSDNKLFTNSKFFSYRKQYHVHQQRPEAFIFGNNMPVLPIPTRPWNYVKSVKYEDKFSTMYNSILKLIVKYNNGDPKKTKEQLYKEIVKNVNCLTLNDISSDKKFYECRKIESIFKVLSDKKGYIQNSINGKRTNLSARTVIIGGGLLMNVDEVGVPQYHVARELTIPEVISQENIENVRNLMERGRTPNFIINGMRFKTSILQKQGTDPVQEGNVVERQVTNGDLAFINRQPSLRVESIQGMKMRMHPWLVFIIPLAIVSGFNADFDGDEMNLHCLTLPGAREELRTKMFMTQHIVSAQNAEPITKLNQDSLNACLLLSGYDLNGTSPIHIFDSCFYQIIEARRNRGEVTDQGQARFRNLFDRAQEFYPSFFQDGLYLTSRIPNSVLLSLVFPVDFTFQESKVEIKNGIITSNSSYLKGSILKKIVHRLWIYYSPSTCEKFLSEAQFICYRWLTFRGFTVGITDCLINQPRSSILESYHELENVTREINEAGDDKKLTEYNVYVEVQGFTGKTIKDIETDPTFFKKGKENRIAIMSESGAKGSSSNAMQISVALGQQELQGRRMPYELAGGTRSLPFYKANEENLEARGFIVSNFLIGLNPKENFFHAITGRKGVVDTGVSTADTGYLSKKLSRKMEDFKMYEDGTVKNGVGNIIQFLYGEHGFNPKNMILTSMDGKGFYFFADIPSLILFYNEQERREVNQGFKDFSPKLQIPKEVVTQVVETQFKKFPVENDVTKEQRQMVIRVLSRLLQDKEIYRDQIGPFFRKLKELYDNAIYKEENMPGLVASLSIGELSTQGTLNTFHYSGNSEKDTTLGMPRLKSIFGSKKKKAISGSKNIIYLKPKSEVGQLYLSVIQNEDKKEEYYDKIFYYGKRLEFRSLEFFIRGINLEKGNNNDQSSPLDPEVYNVYQEPNYVTFYKNLFGVEVPDVHWVIILSLNVNRMVEYDMKAYVLAEILNENEEILAIPGPEVEQKILIFPHWDKINITPLEPQIPTTFKKTKLRTMVTEENAKFFHTRDVILPKILDKQVQGIKGITEVSFPKDPDNLEEGKFSERTIQTVGTNLQQILLLKDVDKTRTTSTDPNEIADIFGIGAAEKVIIKEAGAVLGYKAEGKGKLLFTHLQTLARSMTYRGKTTSVSSAGIFRDEVGPVAKLLFEKSIKTTITSCTFGENDQLSGVSGSLYVGSIPKRTNWKLTQFDLRMKRFKTRQ
jgi:DNA-directed RNA polymerase beta' subunit